MFDASGICDSVDGRRLSGSKEPFQRSANMIDDNFKTVDEVSDAIRNEGLDTCSLIFGECYEV